MSLARSKRWVLLGIGGLLVAGAGVLLSLPIWIPWVLRPILQREGVRYTSYRRLGYARFALTQVTYTNQSVGFYARRVETLLPFEWLRRHYFQTGPTNYLQVDGWKLRISPADSSAPAVRHRTARPGTAESAKPSSTLAVVREAQTNLALLRRWMHYARLSDGAVELPSRTITVPATEWRAGQLSLRLEAPPLVPSTTLDAHLPSQAPWEIRVRVPAEGLDLQLRIQSQAESVLVSGGLVWLTNQVALAAEFGQQGWLPVTASVQAESFRIPARMAELRGYQDLTGAFAVLWADAHFELKVTAAAQPLSGQEHVLFPVTAQIHAQGDTNTVQVERATIEAPWLRLQLTPGAAFDYRGRLLTPQAELHLAADLSKQPWIKATGSVEGNALLTRSSERFPGVVAHVAGAGLESFGVRADKVEIRGELHWPWFELQQADIAWAAGGASALIGKANLQTRFITNAVMDLDGKIAPPGLLPPGMSYQRVWLHANGSGPLQQITYGGALKVQGLEVPRSAPLRVEASWRGHGRDLEGFRAGIAAGGSVLELIGSAQAENGEAGLRLEKLTWTQGKEILYSLQQPSSLSLGRDTGRQNAGPAEWLLNLQPLVCQGGQRSLTLAANVDWPRRGQLKVTIDDLETATLNHFLKEPLPPVRVEQLALAGGWSNGPVTLALALDAHFNPTVRPLRAGRSPAAGNGQPSGLVGTNAAPQTWPFAVHLEAGGDADGLVLKELQVASRTLPVITGRGRFPVSLEPTNTTGRVQVRQDQPVELHAKTVADRAFWEQVSNWVGIGMIDPRLQFEISGALSSPTGRITADIAAIQLRSPSTNRPMPRLEQLRADLGLSRTALRLDSLNLRLENQPVSASGQLPFGPDWSVSWRRFIQWQQATGHVRVAHAQIAPLARFLPNVLSPQGTLEADLAVRPKVQFEGQLALKGAATRPISPIGPVQDIEASLRASGRQLQVRTFSGLIGGDPFAVTGNVDFTDLNPSTGMPQIHLRIRGSNLPLVREPDLILRSDLDLSLANPTNGPVVVTGLVQLRDSVFLSDLKDLKPGKVAQPRRRPPYFSIDVEPLADWRLNLRVRGDKFLRVRSPLFHGEVSTDLRLEGNLREPMALGEVTVNSGTVQFPFANLEVTHGLVSLTSADPFHPQLFVTAGTRTFGYDVKIEVTGSADSPTLQFSSVPPLSSDQIVLMLTAGELPKDTTSTALTAQQRASRLALFLGKNLLSEFAPGQGGADRLTVRSDETLLDPGKPTYTLEYRLTKRWSLVGEYDQYSDLNVGLKWRLYSH